MLDTPKISLTIQWDVVKLWWLSDKTYFGSAQLGKTNFGSVQHRISSWISHLSGRQACPLHGKTNFRSNISIMQNLIELLHLLHFYCNKNAIMQILGMFEQSSYLLGKIYNSFFKDWKTIKGCLRSLRRERLRVCISKLTRN